METDTSCPMTQQELINEFFIEHRTKILDLAGFLDRLDRAREKDATADFRFVAFKEALGALSEAGPGRAERVQMLLSDTTSELLEERDQQGAYGASSRRGGQA